MKKSYDRTLAKSLVPLLESITFEIAERLETVRALDRKARSLPEGDLETTQYLNIMAQLATHRRELRLAKKECERLGCVVDDDLPTRVYIPGSNGDIQHGFLWEKGNSTVQRATPESTTR